MADNNKKTQGDTGGDVQIENIAKNVMKTKKDETSDAKKAAPVSSKKIIKFGKNYEIHSDKVLTQLGSSITTAYKTVDIASGFEAGLSIVLLAILLDRLFKQKEQVAA